MPGYGNTRAKIFICGEASGRTEDQLGIPFAGSSGRLLTSILENELGIKRSSVFIGNIVRCRPTVDMKMEKDRAPDEEEIIACTPYLIREIELVAPHVIIALGTHASKFFLPHLAKKKITDFHGKWGEWHGIPVMPVFHPSFLLRHGGESGREYGRVVADLLRLASITNRSH